MMRTSSIALWLLVGQGCADGPQIFGGADEVQTPHPAARLLAVMDLDGDGQLSENEYSRVAEFPGTFASVDDDGSGGIDAAEMTLLLWRFNPSKGSIKSSHAGPKTDQMTWDDWSHHARNTGLEWGTDE